MLYAVIPSADSYCGFKAASTMPCSQALFSYTGAKRSQPLLCATNKQHSSGEPPSFHQNDGTSLTILRSGRRPRCTAPAETSSTQTFTQSPGLLDNRKRHRHCRTYLNSTFARLNFERSIQSQWQRRLSNRRRQIQPREWRANNGRRTRRHVFYHTPRERHPIKQQLILSAFSPEAADQVTYCRPYISPECSHITRKIDVDHFHCQLRLLIAFGHHGTPIDCIGRRR